MMYLYRIIFSFQIKSLLAASDNNWSELESRGLAIGNLSVVAEFVDPINGRLLALENKSVKNRNKLLNKGFRIGNSVIIVELSVQVLL